MRAIWSTWKYPSIPFFRTSQRQQTRVRKSTNTIERGRPHHKTITITFAFRLLQIGDDQWPHINDVGHYAHRMSRTQIVRQNGLLQSGAR